MYKSNGMEKNPEDRVRRNAETYVIDHVEWDGVTRGPELPEECDWTDRTRSWWNTWRNSPQSMVMTATDWDFMLDTALLYDMMWSFNRPTLAGMPTRGQGAVSLTQLAGEIRQRVAKFGVTYEDRKKLRMSINTPMSDKNFQDEVEDVVVDYTARLKSTVKPVKS